MLKAFMIFSYKPTLFQESHKNLHSPLKKKMSLNVHWFYRIRLKSYLRHC